eukprot:1161009-Pelagomonas_calceolata.AAC.6
MSVLSLHPSIPFMMIGSKHATLHCLAITVVRAARRARGPSPSLVGYVLEVELYREGLRGFCV